MKKGSQKKLRLARETLRDLGIDEVAEAKGANTELSTSGPRCTVFCHEIPAVTFYCCNPA